jgi:kynureninase
MSHDPLLWRAHFPILETSTYLISNSLGAMPRATRERLAEYADTWASRGVRAWEEGWWELPVTVGNLVAPLIGAPPGSVTMHQNVTIAQAIILSCFRPGEIRNKIVCEEGNFPSVMYFYAEQRGLRLVTVPHERLLEAIDDETLLVPASHVLFKSGYIQDAAAIVAKAHRVGARVVLDCFHSAGVIPLDLTALGTDFAVGGCLKWLCGGPGNGWLYVRPDLAGTLHPALTGWAAHEAPFEFAMPPIRQTSGPLKFCQGTPHIPCLYAAMEGLRIIREVGIAAIREHSMMLTERMMDAAFEAGIPTLTPREPERRGGTVAVNPPDAMRISRQLLERNFVIDFRPDAGIRIAPHFYNTADECDSVMAEIASLAGKRPALRLTGSR